MRTAIEMEATTDQLFEDVMTKLKEIVNGSAAAPDVMVGEPVSNIPVPTIAKVMSLIQAFPLFARSTKAVMEADGNFLPNMAVLVTNDPTPANNWIYRRTGAYGLTGAGQWVVADDSLFKQILNIAPALDIPRVAPDGTTFTDVWTGHIKSVPRPVSAASKLPNGRWQISGGAVHDWNCEEAFDAKFAAQLGARDTSSRAPKPGDLYVSWETGNDANTGLLRTLPKKTVTNAYANVTAAGVIWLLDGYSHEEIVVAKSHNLGGGSARPIKIKALGGPGKAFFLGADQAAWEMTWTNPSGTNWEAIPVGASAVRMIVVRDTNGRLTKLRYFSSIANLNANSNGTGWYQDVGTGKVTITLGGQNVNASDVKFTIYLIYNGNGHRFQGTRTFIKDVDFIGSNIAAAQETSGGDLPHLYLQDIYTAYSPSSAIQGNGAIIQSQRVYIDGTCFSDGFGYTIDLFTGTQNTSAVEVDCVAVECGASQGGTDALLAPTWQYGPIISTLANIQASSNHEDGVTIRVNCFYTNCVGAACATASDDTKEWIVGCYFGDPWHFWNSSDTTPQILGDGTMAAAYQQFASFAWCDTCFFGGQFATYGYEGITFAGQAPVAKHFNCRYQGTLGTTTTTGSLTTYTPAAP